MLYLARPAVAAAALLSLACGATATRPSAPAEAVAVRQPGFAIVDGLWCGAGLLREFTLEIAQQYQNVQARLVRKGRVRELTGHVEGSLVKADPQRDHTMELLAQGNELRIVAGTGMLALAKGQAFTRAVGGSCTH